MSAVRHLLLVFLLAFAQLAAGAHAVEHAAAGDDGLPTHVCQLCLATQDLGAALPSLAALPPVVAHQFVPESLPDQGRSALPPPAAHQGAPPRF